MSPPATAPLSACSCPSGEQDGADEAKVRELVAAARARASSSRPSSVRRTHSSSTSRRTRWRARSQGLHGKDWNGKALTAEKVASGGAARALEAGPGAVGGAVAAPHCRDREPARS